MTALDELRDALADERGVFENVPGIGEHPAVLRLRSACDAVLAAFQPSNDGGRLRRLRAWLYDLGITSSVQDVVDKIDLLLAEDEPKPALDQVAEHYVQAQSEADRLRTELAGMERERDACCDDYQREAKRAIEAEERALRLSGQVELLREMLGEAMREVRQ